MKRIGDFLPDPIPLQATIDNQLRNKLCVEQVKWDEFQIPLEIALTVFAGKRDQLTFKSPFTQKFIWRGKYGIVYKVWSQCDSQNKGQYYELTLYEKNSEPTRESTMLCSVRLVNHDTRGLLRIYILGATGSALRFSTFNELLLCLDSIRVFSQSFHED
ncbi:MAG: hypothetical protein V4686_01275 [Patescibacteria group bacterium]